MSKITIIIKKILYPNTYSSAAYIEYLKKKQIIIGENCHIFSPKSVSIDVFRPYLLKIGDNVVICEKTTILTHDYSHTVISNLYGRNIGDAKPVLIGNNVFVGMGTMILMGSEIGDNVIIGAQSVVRGKIPSNSVVAGNPAKVVCTLEEYYQKRIKQEEECAKINVLLAKERLGRVPTIYEMGDAFAWLYLPHTEDTVKKYPDFFDLPGKNKNQFIKSFLSTKGQYLSYQEYLNSIVRDDNG